MATKIQNEFEVWVTCPFCRCDVVVKNQYNPPRYLKRGGKPHTSEVCREKTAQLARRDAREKAKKEQGSLNFDGGESCLEIEEASQVDEFNRYRAECLKLLGNRGFRGFFDAVKQKT